jgi:hypothetical protein
MAEREELRSALLASARRELQLQRAKQRAVVDKYSIAQEQLQSVRTELLSLQSLWVLLEKDLAVMASFPAQNLSLLMNVSSDVQEQLRTVEADISSFASAEGVLEQEVLTLRSNHATLAERVNKQRDQLDAMCLKREALVSVRLERMHHASLIRLLTDDIAALQKEETELNSIIKEANVHAVCIQSRSESAMKETMECFLKHDDDLDAISTSVFSDTISEEDQHKLLAVVHARHRIEWISSSLQSGKTITGIRNELERCSLEFEKHHYKAVIWARRRNLEEEVGAVSNVIGSTTILAEEAESDASRLPTLTSVSDAVTARRQQVERLEHELAHANEDLAMLQDHRAAERCKELSHAVKSYVSVTVPGAMDALRSKREELHQLKVSIEQWPSEKQRHIAFVSTLTSEQHALKIRAAELENARLRSLAAKHRRNQHPQTEMISASCTGALGEESGSAALLDGNEIRYIPLPNASNVVFLPDASSESAYNKKKKKPHFNFLAVTLMNKLQLLVGNGSRRLISLNV